MKITDSEGPGKVAEVRRVLSRLVEQQSYSNVEFIECSDPAYDPDQDDYFLAYEAVFRPKDLAHAHLEIWVTDDGDVSIMFEKRVRLARRLGVRLWTAKEACAAGREPSSIPVSELVAFVRLVAQGKVFIKARSGIFGLGATKAIVSEKDFATLRVSNWRQWDWLSVKTDQALARLEAKLIAFQSW